MFRSIGSGNKGAMPQPPPTWTMLARKDRDTLIEQPDTLIEQSDTLIEQSDTLIEQSDTLIEQSPLHLKTVSSS